MFSNTALESHVEGNNTFECLTRLCGSLYHAFENVKRPNGKKIHGLRIEIKNDVFDNRETEDPGASLKRHKTEPEFRGGM